MPMRGVSAASKEDRSLRALKVSPLDIPQRVPARRLSDALEAALRTGGFRAPFEASLTL